MVTLSPLLPSCGKFLPNTESAILPRLTGSCQDAGIYSITNGESCHSDNNDGDAKNACDGTRNAVVNDDDSISELEHSVNKEAFVLKIMINPSGLL